MFFVSGISGDEVDESNSTDRTEKALKQFGEHDEEGRRTHPLRLGEINLAHISAC